MKSNQRRMNGTLLLLAACCLAPAAAAWGEAGATPENTGSKMRVYIGTYTGRNSQGIYQFDFDTANGKASEPELAGEAANPSFLAVSADGKFLYCVSESGGNGSNKKVGMVNAMAVDPATGKLTLLNQQPSGGEGPCHVTIDASGKFLLTTNYASGSVSVLPINADGTLGAATAFDQHTGSGPMKGRQDGPHAHSANMDPTNRFAIVCDLGLDKVFVYRLNGDGTLMPNDPPTASVAPGGGPRHFTFHPNGKIAYVINEMGSTVTTFQWDADKGTLTEVQTIGTLPEGSTAKNNTTAEVKVHPSGKFLYGSNRGDDSIAMFAVDPATGKLSALGHVSCGGKTPRNFAIDPTGKWLLAANQNSNNICVFRIDPTSGKLEPTGEEIKVSHPVCVKFYTPGK